MIYAGATWEDNCTAIGGGGNEYGRVVINGGTVTAVTASTGTAIGGGIGWGSPGGDADVTINNGAVYAYNMGIHGEKSTDKYEHYVPAVAIGGGSSQNSSGNKNTTVNINGGKVYAQSMGGAAIGGGGSTKQAGGDATINIKGGEIIAKSTEGTFKGTKDTEVQSITAGVSIGGGTGLTSGGSVTLNVTEGKLRTGSIGGGLTTEEGKPVGSANVTITGGDIIGQVIMAGGGSKACSFTMEGGRIHDTDLINGNKIKDLTDPRPDIPIKYVRDNGGAVFMNDEKGITTITGGTIEGCTANNGGAIYMNGGTANITGGTINNNTAVENGGGVYLPGGNFTLNGGTISGNSAQNGGGIFLSKAPVLNKGTIAANKASENGGGMYISDCVVELRPDGDLSFNENSAKDGAGIYIHDSSENTDSEVQAVTTATPDKRVGLLIDSDFEGNLSFKNNKAAENGGAACVNKGHFYLYSDNVTVTGNSAKNGGGVAVLEGNFTMTAGSIGAENGANTADNGGGAYVSGGEIWLKGGSIKYNEATKNGGGAYVSGNYSMTAGEVVSNKSSNGGGIYVNDGLVTMYGGRVDSNTAGESGGGMYISSTRKEALVDIFSGSVSGNKSKSGGGVAVVSESDTNINVTVGVNCVHPDLNEGNYTSFEYPDAAGCGEAHSGHGNHIEDENLIHSSCPQVKNNVASENGGGFFLKSPNTKLVFYCITENGNKADGKEQCYNMDVLGGHVEIGDKSYNYHDKENPVKGNITMTSSIFVEGGTVDVYGKMDNPKFTDDVTVDIKQDTDHYIDHRLTEDNELKFYKVHYYENFKGDGDTPTGLYIARQYPDIDHDQTSGDKKYDFTVMSSIFVHPGYKIVGWNTKPDNSGEEYKVNETYNLKDLEHEGKLGATNSGNEDDKSLLVIYAIWERTGYVLKFDPNVSEGETYTGTMANQGVTIGLLDGTQSIALNQFVRPGYEFLGWTLDPSPADDDRVYKDGETIKEDFTDKDGAAITLYAKWKRCSHVGFLTYTADKNVLTQSCSKCGGHTATAAVSAVNSSYDGKEHLADVDFSANWIGTKPEISYEMAESQWDDKDDIDDNWTEDSVPVHAGTYTAKITAANQTDGAEAAAQAEYIISPVKWETPKSPQILFKVIENAGTDLSIIEISEPKGDNIEYMIKRLNTSTDTIEDIPGYTGWLTNREFSNIPFGYYYYFYAKKCADRDHLESEESRSDAYLADGGNIVYIKNAEGIKVEPDLGGGSFKYTVSADEGYHLRNYTYKESDSAIPGAASARKEKDSITITKSGPTYDKYTYEVTFETNKVAYWQVTLEFSGAVKNASVSHKVTDGQIFGDFNNKNILISRDSAFTARFTVSDYIPDEYEGQALKFSEKLPVGTAVIMKTDDGSYWHYKLSEAKDSIDLTEFTAMGGTEKFSFDTAGTSEKEFTYQFIVDFSQSTGAALTDKFEVSLGLTAKPQHAGSDSQSAPTIPEAGEKQVSLGIEEKASFEIQLAGVSGKSATFNCIYAASKGAASIWNDRETALVLTAKPAVEVPADLTLTTVVDGKTTLYKMNSEKQFIIPLGEIRGSEVKATLNSRLFGASAKDLEFTADWYVSKSSADKSPLNGYKAASKDVTLSCKKDASPSVRIDGTNRLCQVGGTLKVTVNYAGVSSGGSITAYLQRENGEVYVDTGAKVSVENDANIGAISSKDISFNMGQMPKGSYRILVIVQESGANVLQVPYYFVIQ